MTARVLIDGHMLGGDETGNETYVRCLLAGLEEIGRRELVAVTAPHIDVGAHRAVVLPRRSDFARLAIDLAAAARDHDVDVVHSTYMAPLLTTAASVVTVHDVSFVRHPEWFTLRDRVVLNAGVRTSVRRAARVLVPSGHARDELCGLLAVPPDRVVVTPEGVDARFAPPAEPLLSAQSVVNLRRRGDPRLNGGADVFYRRLGIRRPYVLTVGNLQPRKNLARLVEAWAILSAAGADAGHSLVVAGGFRGRRDGAPALTISAGIGDRVVFPGYVGEADLPALYAGAALFVFPSLYEGFGLPILEAMACGTPVACSRVTSLPEVAAGAAALFDPRDPRDMAAVIGALLADDALLAELRTRGLRRAASATWRGCAELTAAAYEAAAASRRPSPPRRPRRRAPHSS